MHSNSAALRDALERFADVPFALLPEAEQRLAIGGLGAVFQKIIAALAGKGMEATVLAGHVRAMEALTRSGFDEHKFLSAFKPFLESLQANQRSRSYAALGPVAERFLARAAPLWASESQASKYREAHGPEEVRAHDAEILRKPMQLYALDYFLFMHEKLARAAPEEFPAAILKGADKLPALAADALEDDMLKKVVYSLAGRDIRRRMIRDYYEYKKAFLPALAAESLTAEKTAAIMEALRAYCMSLVDISLEYGIAGFEHSLLDPYNRSMDLQEIKRRLTNG